MKATDLAAYFSKKIAKPIVFSVNVQRATGPEFWVYELEVAAVEESVVHMSVNLRGTRNPKGQWLLRHDVNRGDIEIPIRDGDYVSLVLGMAVAIRGLGDRCERLPSEDTLRGCYDEYLSRQEEALTASFGARM